MELTNKQKEGLEIALKRYKNKEKYTVISGYAGTGKSTLVRFIIDALDVDKTKVAYACFTGKAAEVLRKKGNDNAMTMHRLLYDNIPKKEGGFIRKPKQELGYDIIVADEISMLPKDMVNMLLKYPVYVLFLGDPFQLPQIDKEQSHNLLDEPHIFLDQVMRQAAESEIIQLTMKIRAGEDIDYFKGKEVQILPKSQLTQGMMTWADQIICATNATKNSMNNQMRSMLGYSGMPQTGERMICLRNYWEDTNEEGDALVNGTTGIIKFPEEGTIRLPSFVKNDRRELPIIAASFVPDSGSAFSDLSMDRDMIEKGEKCIDWRVSYQLGKMKVRYGDLEPKEFAYGYAITCHKAQGSEWEKVLVIEERFPFDKIEHARWLYTACTRASEKLVLIRG